MVAGGQIDWRACYPEGSGFSGENQSKRKWILVAQVYPRYYTSDARGDYQVIVIYDRWFDVIDQLQLNSICYVTLPRIYASRGRGYYMN